MIEQALVLDEMGRTGYAGPVLRHRGAGRHGSRGRPATRELPAEIADGSSKATLAVLEDAISWQP